MKSGCACVLCRSSRRLFQALREYLVCVLRMPPLVPDDHMEDYRDALGAVEAILEKDGLPGAGDRTPTEER